MTELPAAHSMDTAWFAVDADGHVARFETGEDGALPVEAAHRGGPDDPNFDVHAFVAALARRSGTDLEEGAYTERLPGVFDYRRDHGDDLGRYQRAHVPEDPVRISELPPSTQEAIGAFRLPVYFSEAEIVHLAEHIDDSQAVTWHDWPLRWPEGGADAFFEGEAKLRRAFAEQRLREDIRMAWIGLFVLLVFFFALLLGLRWWQG